MENLDSTKQNHNPHYGDSSFYTIKSYAKINIFLKITGHKNGYHTLLSRFAKVNNLYDDISFIPSKCDSFKVEGFSDLPIENNLIYISYKEIEKYLSNSCRDFFKDYKVVVKKRIPQGAGLGGGSSNSAYFLLLLRRVCNLDIDIDTLAKIGAKIGADVPFFIYDYKVANVKGFGEIVEEFNDIDFNIELFTPNIHSNTADVYKYFKNNYLKDIDIDSFKSWEYLNSKEILKIASPTQANDLFKSALALYPKLKNYQKDSWYFSGSGSSFFKLHF